MSNLFQKSPEPEFSGAESVDDRRVIELEAKVNALQSLLKTEIQSKAEAFEALNYQLHRYEGLMNSAPVAIALIESDLSYREVNDFFAAAIKHERSEFSGRKIGSIDEPLSLQKEISDFIYDTETQQDQSREISFTIDGVEQHWLLIFQKRTVDDSISMLGIDISERIEAERQAEELTFELTAQQKASEKLAQDARTANDSKSAFLAMMSHEIRTPMNAILGMAHLVRDTELNPMQMSYVNLIHESGESLLGIINDVLDLSKIEAGKLDIENVDINLKATAEGVIQQFGPAAAEKDVYLSCFVSPDVPRSLCGDPVRIRQILMNLIGNAIKFTDKGEVALSIWVKDPVNNPGRVHFKVTDSGIGISDDAKKKLFQAFCQADVSTTRKYGGTGLGLNISKQLVEKMGGEIKVASEIGVGSIFAFDLNLNLSGKAPAPIRPSRKVAVVLQTERELLRKELTHYLNSNQIPVITEQNYDKIPEGYFIVYIVDDINTVPQSIAASDQPVKVVGLPPSPLCTSKIENLFFPTRGPLQTTQSGKTRQESVTRNAFSDVKILLVEDIPNNQLVATKFFERLGCTVTVAENGLEAVNTYNQEPFDVVFMDCQMPVMDGFEATQKIRESNNGTEIPIIAMTGNVMRGFRDQCLEAGMDDHLGKPFDPKDLETCLGRWVPNHSIGQEPSNRVETYLDN